MFALRMEKPIGLMAITAVDHDEIAGIVEEIREQGKAAAANAFIAYANAFFEWCVSDGRRRTGLALNPCAAVKKTKANSRARFLSSNEIKYLWAALERESGDIWRDGYRLALLTGMRREEIFGMRVNEVNLAERVIELPETRTKNGLAHIVPFSPMAGEILARRVRSASGDFLFQSNLSENSVSGFSKAHARICDRMNEIAGAELAKWVLHDLRRTVSTGLNGLLDENERPLVLPATVEAFQRGRL